MNKYCPICNKFLFYIPSDNGFCYNCPTRAQFELGPNISHYQDIHDLTIIFIPPYCISSFKNIDKSDIYIYKSPEIDQPLRKYGNPDLEFIATTSKIHPDSIDKLLKRIKLLTLLS